MDHDIHSCKVTHPPPPNPHSDPVKVYKKKNLCVHMSKFLKPRILSQMKRIHLHPKLHHQKNLRIQNQVILNLQQIMQKLNLLIQTIPSLLILLQMNPQILKVKKLPLLRKNQVHTNVPITNLPKPSSDPVSPSKSATSMTITPDSSPTKSSSHPAVFYNVSPKGHVNCTLENLKTLQKEKNIDIHEEDVEEEPNENEGFIPVTGKKKKTVDGSLRKTKGKKKL